VLPWQTSVQTFQAHALSWRTRHTSQKPAPAFHALSQPGKDNNSPRKSGDIPCVLGSYNPCPHIALTCSQNRVVIFTVRWAQHWFWLIWCHGGCSNSPTWSVSAAKVVFQQV